MLEGASTVAARIVQQMVRDRRTLVLIVVMPLVVMTLIGLSFPENGVLDYAAPALLATLALFFSFLLTGISFLRERSQGTMERLMASPVSRLDIVVGYLLGFLSLPWLRRSLFSSLLSMFSISGMREIYGRFSSFRS